MAYCEDKPVSLNQASFNLLINPQKVNRRLTIQAFISNVPGAIKSRFCHFRVHYPRKEICAQ